jgi:hypothetical protein
MQIAPGIGSLVGRAVAIAQAGELAAGFAALEQIPAGSNGRLSTLLGRVRTSAPPAEPKR